MYDPQVPLEPDMERTRLALPGNRGVFTHPSLRPRTQGTATGRRKWLYDPMMASYGSQMELKTRNEHQFNQCSAPSQ
mgnify:CR=1 FL=1